MVMPMDKSAYFLFLSQNVCCVYSKDCLNEMVLLSTQKTRFYHMKQRLGGEIMPCI